MNLKLNETTWYSRLVALFIFLLIIPIIAFCVGRNYQQVVDINYVESFSQLESSSRLEKETNSSKDYLDLKQKLAKTLVDKTLLQIQRDSYRGPFVSSSYPNRFYYTYSNSDSKSSDFKIGYYEFSDNDLNSEYLHSKINNNTKWIYTKNLPIEVAGFTHEFRIIGFDGTKLVFYETMNADTPGPCESLWFRNTQYIDITNDTNTPKPYILSEEKKQKYQKEEEDCVKENS